MFFMGPPSVVGLAALVEGLAGFFVFVAVLVGEEEVAWLVV